MYSSTRLCHISKSVCVRCFDQMAKRAHPFFKVQKDSDFQVLLFLHYLHIGYIGILICISTLLDCKTVRIFAYSSTREQSNKRSGMRRARKTLTPRFTDFFTDFEKKTDCFAV